MSPPGAPFFPPPLEAKFAPMVGNGGWFYGLALLLAALVIFLVFGLRWLVRTVVSWFRLASILDILSPSSEMPGGAAKLPTSMGNC